MDVRLLGPIEVSVDGRPLAIGASKPRALLAMLALRAGSVVSADRLIDGLWGDRPPVSATKLVQLYVSQLRKTFTAGGAGATIVTRGHGYELSVAAEDVDVGRFRRLAAAGRPREALALWRGPPLSDVAEQPFAVVEARRLEEMRLAAVEDAVERDLQAGRHAEVAGELELLSLEEPLRERLHAQRMMALYRSGRQADALEVYRQTRAALVDAIGAEPGPEMQRLHQSILRQEPWLDLPIEEPVDLPAELETRTPMAGRDADLARLREHWRSARGGSGRLVTITGPGGIGKTRLAAEIAGEAHRDGATVLFTSGVGTSTGVFTALASARAARRPMLVVLDDADRFTEDVQAAVTELAGELAGLPVLVVAIAGEHGADGVDTVALGPLDTDGVRAVARLYGDDIPVEALVTASEGIPRHVHRAAADWAGREAARRLGDAASRAARERAGLRDAGRTAAVSSKGSRTSPWRFRRAVVVLGTLALVAVAAAVLLLAGEPGERAVAAGSSAGVYDPETGKLLTSIPLGTAPSTVAVGERGAWVLDADDKTVSRIDPSGRTVVRTFSTGSTPTDLAVGAGAIWVGNGFRRAGLHGTFLPASISRIDPGTNDVIATIPLHRGRTGPYVQGDAIVQQHIAVSGDAVWAINPDLTVSRIDPRVNRVVARVTDVKAVSLAAGDGRVWAVDHRGSVAEIDTRTNRVARRIEVPTESLTALAVGAGAVWVSNTLGGSVWRIDPEPELLLHEIPLALGVGRLAFGAESVWATNEIAGKVYRIDPRTNRARVVSRVAAPRDIAFGAGAVWVTGGGPPSPDEALPAAACGRVFTGGGGGSPLLLVSNLPLQGGWRDATLPMVDAIRFVLERRGFKAGRFHVAYQSCNESTPKAHGFDFYRCYSNAKAFAHKPNVIGVIGAHSSFCSKYQIPIANQAAGGPLAMISPSNTWTGLTRPYQGMRRGELEARYPSGERNYVRLAAADHLQAVADAELARQLGSKRLFVLAYGDDPYLAGFAADVRRAAQNRGLEIAGSAAWNPEARHFGRLARRIGRARADAVFIGGHLLPNGGRLVRDLRARLGPQVDLVATDYFSTIPDLTTAAGPAAAGMYVSVFGVPNSELPRNGKRFLADFEASRGGDPSPPFAAAYAAQAAEIMLDSIGRSDGTRASVTRELRRTRIDGGILGDIRFDEYGDLIEGPFTILRVTDGAPRHALVLPQFEGAVVDRMITARLASKSSERR